MCGHHGGSGRQELILYMQCVISLAQEFGTGTDVITYLRRIFPQTVHSKGIGSKLIAVVLKGKDRHGSSLAKLRPLPNSALRVCNVALRSEFRS